MYDFIIVGAGLFGSTFAYLAKQQKKNVLVVDSRPHIGGNCYTEYRDGIYIHKYGAHIFHIQNKKIWDFITQFTEVKPYTHSPIAMYHGRVLPMPFNMHTFSVLFGTTTPEQAMRKIEEERERYVLKRPAENLEETALSLVGKTIYEMLVKEYTTKQWGKEPKDLPADTMRRIPLRFTYDNSYFNTSYVGIPVSGYTNIFSLLLKGVDLHLNTKYDSNYHKGKKIIYTGNIDGYYDYMFGRLEYRTLNFIEKTYNTDNHQGVSVINYTDNTPYTRSIEHRHFDNNCKAEQTIVSYEYSSECKGDDIPYYPIETKTNLDILKKYKDHHKKYGSNKKDDNTLYFGGRLGEYKYFDMENTIQSAFDLFSKIEAGTYS